MLQESGLGFTANFLKEGGFVGKDAVLAQKAEQKRMGGLLRRVVCVRVRDEIEGVPGPFLYVQVWF